MTQNFVRYNPDVEQLEPDFEQTLQTVLDNMKQRMRGSLEAKVYRKELSQEMDPVEVAEAQRNAREWLAQG